MALQDHTEAPPGSVGDETLAALLEALDEPAALIEADGLLAVANDAWIAAVGGLRRPLGEDLFPIFRQAWRSGRGAGEGRVGAARRAVTFARVESHLFLVRLSAPPAPPSPSLSGAPALETPSPVVEAAGQASAQRQKMEAIGQLAGGVAHDFNNLLSAIGMRIDDLLLRHPLGDPAYETLAEVRESVDRAGALVLQLLTFSRKATVRRETVDLGEALMDFEILLRRLLRETVRLETDYAPATPLVRVDRGQLEMAIMNLVVNARDALAGGGTIRLRTDRVGPEAAAALGHPGPFAGDMALIEVADDGPGIPPAVIDSIFEPFFTTKAAGEGTGLGLATVYGIVKQSEGAIVAVSPPGQGASFRIFLPAHAPRVTLAAPPEPPRRAPRDLSGAGRILLVEDEERVRDIAARLLRRQGYEVIEAADGAEALELARAHAGAIDLMISDVSMPGLDGPSLLKAARPYLGAAPVIFISGYAESEFSDLLEGEAGVTFVPKPLSLPTLAERVKQRLRTG